MKRFKAVVTAVLAVALSAGIAHAKVIKVGFIAPLSGPASDMGRDMERGVKLYLARHAVPGGHTVEIIRRDSTGPKADVAKRLALELVTQDKVDVLAGVVFSNNAIAILDVANKAKVPVMLMNAATSSITALSPYVARSSFTLWQSAYPFGEYAATKMGIKRIALAYANYASGKDTARAFRMSYEKAGGQVIADIPFPFPDIPDFTPFLQRIKDAKPDAVYVFVPGGKWGTSLLKTYQAMGLREAGIKLLATQDIVMDSELAGIGDVANGVISIGHYSAAADRPANKAFVAAFKKAHGADAVPNFFTVGAWDGMDAIFHAIDKTGGDMKVDKVLAAWKTWRNNSSPRGPAFIDPATRDIVHNEYIRETKRIDGRLINFELTSIPSVRDPLKELGLKEE
jgi:branched-chain amino acid transport system substrate-binding protein